jgi:hypothetical protein
MIALRLASFEDVRKARHCAGDLAQAAGIEDRWAVEQVAAELGNNCVEHGNGGPGLLWIDCKPGRLSLRFENSCERRPDWVTQKPLAVGGFHSGGYGLALAHELAGSLFCSWGAGRVIISAEFSKRR